MARAEDLQVRGSLGCREGSILITMTLEKFSSREPVDASAYFGQRTAQVETLIRKAADEFLLPVMEGSLAIVAVGGFGRRELFPRSDIDLLLLVHRTEAAENAKEPIGYFLRALWDAGLVPSHSVHTVDECCQIDASNIELTISLLTQRYLFGNRALYEQLTERLPEFIRSQRRKVNSNLLQMSGQRHSRFQNTIYHLEPDGKESPGGIRDLHLIEWLGLIRGAPYQDALDSVKAARQFLFDVRLVLHERSKRDDNRLTFDAQDELFTDPAEAMREYYRHTRDVFREARQVMAVSDDPSAGMLRSFLDWRSRLSTTDFTVSREQVLLRSPQMLEADPRFVMRLMQFVARHGFMLAPDTERRLGTLVRSSAFQVPKYGLWRELRDLLSLPHAAKAIRAMHESGYLKAIIPEWSRIECLVTRDFYHRYTVDEHTLVALDGVDTLVQAPDDARGAFRVLLSETPDIHLLRLALLLHDIGKGGGTGEHSEESTRIAREVLTRLGADQMEMDTVLYLIEHHLDLSSLMTSRDLQDHEVAEAAAHQIGTLERLQLLTLLTYCDINAVNPTALTPWRMSQLLSAYRSLHRELTSELETDRIAAHAASDSPRGEFLDGFPTRYLQVHTPAEVDAHFALAQQALQSQASVDLRQDEKSWQLTVVSKDRPGLLANLAGALSSFGMNILRAEAFSNRHGLILDIFRFSDPARRLEYNPEEVPDLVQLIERVAAGKESVDKRLASRPRPPAPSRRSRVTPVVQFSGDASARATLMEIVAEDRPGLLYDLANGITAAGCNIEVVLINTEAHKALDVFYLTSNGSKLTSAKQRDLRERLLSALQT